VHEYVARFVDQQTGGRVWLESVEVSEHGGNSAIYQPSLAAQRGGGRLR
jgi:6-pyruvoyltetrahydropterin/6-carboxytetrahydropterin synthase